MTISLNGSDLTVTQVVAVARHGETVALAPEAIAAMRVSRAVEPIDITVLIDALARQGTDFALGSRFLGTSLNQPLSRRMLLKAATLFTRLTTGLRVTDTHNGLRAMTRRGASSINLRQNRMAHASEILHQIASSGLNYVEAPVRIEYSAYSLAKGQTLGDTLMIVLDLFARRLHR